MDSLTERKRAERAVAAGRREAAARDGPEAAQAACARLVELLAPGAGDVVAGYLPVRTELDPVPALERAIRAGAETCVPRVEGKGAPLVFLAWRPGAELQPGAFGVRVPVTEVFRDPTLVIVPLLAWDRSGARLGYGGGFYDRTLQNLRAVGRLRMAVGFAYAGQEIAEVPRDGHDVLLDAVVTEAETLRWRR